MFTFFSMSAEYVNIGQSPGTKYEVFPEKYSLWFYVDGQPMYIDLVKDERVSSSLSPETLKLTTYLPRDVMTDENTQVCELFVQGNNENLNRTARWG